MNKCAAHYSIGLSWIKHRLMVLKFLQNTNSRVNPKVNEALIITDTILQTRVSYCSLIQTLF